MSLIVLTVCGLVGGALGLEGVTLATFHNTAFAKPATTQVTPLSGSWPNHTGVLSALWSGSLVPPNTTSYRFNCTFIGGYGLAWVDGHFLCNHGMPAYANQVGPLALNLIKDKPVSILLQFAKNTSAPADASAELLWSTSAAFSPVPVNFLSIEAPSPAWARMHDLKREQYTRTAGWGSWDAHNLLAGSCLLR